MEGQGQIFHGLLNDAQHFRFILRAMGSHWKVLI